MPLAYIDQPPARTLLDAVTTTTASAAVAKRVGRAYSFHARVAGTGSVSASVDIRVSNQDVDDAGDVDQWVVAATIALSGTTTDDDGVTLSADAPWRWYSARAYSHSGTGAAVTVVSAEG